jgi:polar amino acid transport system substrate-binding protein
MSLDKVFVTSEEACELTPTGRLRAAINFGNPILANRDPKTGDPYGVSVDLATRLAALINAPLQLILYDAAGEVVAGCERGEWDVAFVARDSLRGKGIEQTRPYLLIEGAYLVPENSPIRQNDGVDRTGTRVVVGKGSAYDLYLSRALQKAEIIRSPTSPAVVKTMMSEGYEHPVIRKSCALRPESLDHEGGIHGSLQADPDGFGARFAIALAAQETAQ